MWGQQFFHCEMYKVFHQFPIEGSLWITMSDRLAQGVTPVILYAADVSDFALMWKWLFEWCEMSKYGSHLHTSRACSRWLPFSLFPLPPLLLSCSVFFSLSSCLVVSCKLSREMYCFRRYKRLCIILSISFLLSLPLFLLLSVTF